MTEITQKYAFNHLVSLHKFDTSIERVMDRTWSLLGGRQESSLFPILIGINVHYRDQPDAFQLFRKFFNHLITLRDKHFVRFVTDTLWAMESDSGYSFYTHDGPKDNRCDVIWSIGAMNDKQVEIEVRVGPKTPRSGLLEDLSKSLKTFVGGTKGDVTDRTLCDTMLNFYDKTKHLYQVTHLQEDLHVLLTPTFSGSGYYPVPVYGMSYFDAKRHYKNVTDYQRLLRYTQYEIFDEDVGEGDMLYILLSLIQNTHKFDSKNRTAQESYALAEMLFGFWATFGECDKTNHDLILFHTTNHDLRKVNVFLYSLNYLYSRR